MKSIHLIIAVLALSLFGIVAGDLGLFSGLSLETRRVIGLTEFGANMVIAIYGAVAFRRIAWSAYLVLSIVGFVLVSATTPSPPCGWYRKCCTARLERHAWTQGKRTHFAVSIPAS